MQSGEMAGESDKRPGSVKHVMELFGAQFMSVPTAACLRGARWIDGDSMGRYLLDYPRGMLPLRAMPA